MAIKSDAWLRMHGKDIFDPYEPSLVSSKNGKKIISYGTSSYGYDLSLADEWQVFQPHPTKLNQIIDPHKFDPKLTRTFKKSFCIIPPHGFVLCRSREYIKMPRTCLGICTGKSTYARCGVIANVTPLEPEWEGHVTIELSNTTPLPVKVYANEGVVQLVLHEGVTTCLTSYKDRQGKYQGQTGITLPRT